MLQETGQGPGIGYYDVRSLVYFHCCRDITENNTRILRFRHIRRIQVSFKMNETSSHSTN